MYLPNSELEVCVDNEDSANLKQSHISQIISKRWNGDKTKTIQQLVEWDRLNTETLPTKNIQFVPLLQILCSIILVLCYYVLMLK